MKTLPIDYLNECFAYDSTKGELIWKVRPRNHFSSDKGQKSHVVKHSGKKAGGMCKRRGYEVVGITFEGRFKIYLSHRIIWAMHNGRWPLFVDHIDLDTSNNRISNLRECTHSQNLMNQRGKGRYKKGAYFNKRLGKWQSAICVMYKQIHLGTFNTEDEAHDAYQKACVVHHGDFSRKE